jgi:hypothetical protein
MALPPLAFDVILIHGRLLNKSSRPSILPMYYQPLLQFPSQDSGQRRRRSVLMSPLQGHALHASMRMQAL